MAGAAAVRVERDGITEAAGVEGHVFGDAAVESICLGGVVGDGGPCQHILPVYQVILRLDARQRGAVHGGDGDVVAAVHAVAEGDLVFDFGKARVQGDGVGKGIGGGAQPLVPGQHADRVRHLHAAHRRGGEPAGKLVQAHRQIEGDALDGGVVLGLHLPHAGSAFAPFVFEADGVGVGDEAGIQGAVCPPFVRAAAHAVGVYHLFAPFGGVVQPGKGIAEARGKLFQGEHLALDHFYAHGAVIFVLNDVCIFLAGDQQYRTRQRRRAQERQK